MFKINKYSAKVGLGELRYLSVDCPLVKEGNGDTSSLKVWICAREGRRTQVWGGL